MQAQRVAPPDMICKDQFLVQSTVVPAGTSDDDITPSIVSCFVVVYKVVGPDLLFWFLTV